MAIHGSLRQWAVSVVFVLAFAWSGGCREEESRSKLNRLEGVVRKIDHRNGVLTVRFYSEKHRRERTVEVRVTPESEIIINGALATLADAREGERASGSVRVEKRGERTIYTAVRVEIRRSAPLKPTSRGAAPAGSSGGS